MTLSAACAVLLRVIALCCALRPALRVFLLNPNKIVFKFGGGGERKEEGKQEEGEEEEKRRRWKEKKRKRRRKKMMIYVTEQAGEKIITLNKGHLQGQDSTGIVHLTFRHKNITRASQCKKQG